MTTEKRKSLTVFMDSLGSKLSMYALPWEERYVFIEFILCLRD